QPTIGLLATGNELREAGQPLEPGAIYESNRAGLTVLVRAFGGNPRLYPLVADTESATQAALERAFAECDAVVTSGGVSVGELDCVQKVFRTMGGGVEF